MKPKNIELAGRAALACSICLMLNFSSYAAENGTEVSLWTPYETAFASAESYDNPFQDVDIEVRFTAPSGEVTTVDAFWDGEDVWRVRFSPDELGVWRYTTVSSDSDNGGLHDQDGWFRCIEYKDSNPLYVHGPLRVDKGETYLKHEDGTPFFWLSDTCWGGALLSKKSAWDEYLRDRKSKEFTVIQFMGTQNIAAAGDAQGRQAYAGREEIRVDPYFFQRLDERLRAINDMGLVASPTFCWAAEWHPSGKLFDPGAYLPDDQLIKFCRYFVARYGAYQVVWMFAGDGYYTGEAAERWRKIGRAVFGENPRRPVTVHPAGRKLHKAEFGSEPWLSFIGYQSSHSSGDETIGWIVKGEPATQWDDEPVKPVINIEPIYERHMNYGRGRPSTDYDVRQAVWLSLLTTPTAGVSYGAHGVWSWETREAVPANHYATGVAEPWWEAIDYNGSFQMEDMHKFMQDIDWWKLRPATDELVVQDEDDVQKMIVASMTTDNDCAVCYLPDNEQVLINPEPLGGNVRGTWFQPDTWKRMPASPVEEGELLRFDTPATERYGGNDYVLLLWKAPKRQPRVTIPVESVGG
ncbi:MAG: DUF4038 domain-containing protein [Verrucomicrobia bacterium]|nr:DUF4038 domain-containing protein [Verrucomicrobiota bacterium]MCF7708188.1 DUF4038 domain-containing protein [Verrucomicrobiota bacterium]